MLQEVIETKLHNAFQPQYLKVINESYMHNVPVGSESHFKVIVVSSDFEGVRLIARHRQVNQALLDELSNHIHALAIHTYTPQEWREQQDGAPDSPMCMGNNH
ncbi:transcriptional regulator BolA [Vibrio cincinnatiensis]|jgi:BolA protein|uniref:DNA-binding transcriptional regulator BolA n=1 Tax=Vibrio cincinnatiensis DSM 19608 TaxID=1123491 RepID=A0A1T4SIF7_VIBCI|nr:transcriptional regulator BolA [Vibrio cincinnatiensis]MCG3724007.1 transcriptional regulator BolA [Vibrio cincinnatiensis]MCG3727495.1 transcriptional regulator BolA [Vibrio cincinnatiensis]MCG3734509.1 transcriptional regulator BolA [Vibrio cincinnatiensis]MCG3737984.1 transcriptional regulator BolA [Vibrio cincinnatiensis]MCG3738674.1 transcriptional regulator BolA [Vibrio cincinnatiensis]